MKGSSLEMGHHDPIRRSQTASEIPDKLYFRIGEVAKLCDVPAYVLRFWESEFPQLKPNKGGTGQRLYRRRDVEMALRVRSLLKDEGYTIPGARAVLKAEFRQKEPQLPLLQGSITPDQKYLRSIRRELESIADMLSRPPGEKKPRLQPVHTMPSPRRARPDGAACAQSGEFAFEPPDSDPR